MVRTQNTQKVKSRTVKIKIKKFGNKRTSLIPAREIRLWEPAAKQWKWSISRLMMSLCDKIYFSTLWRKSLEISDFEPQCPDSTRAELWTRQWAGQGTEWEPWSTLSSYFRGCNDRLWNWSLLLFHARESPSFPTRWTMYVAYRLNEEVPSQRS